MNTKPFDMIKYAERVVMGPLTAEERMHQDKTPEKAPEAPRYCASCGDPLDPGQFKWCSRQCVEEDDGPYGPDDEDDDEPEPEDEEPADEPE